MTGFSAVPSIKPEHLVLEGDRLFAAIERQAACARQNLESQRLQYEVALKGSGAWDGGMWRSSTAILGSSAGMAIGAQRRI